MRLVPILTATGLVSAGLIVVSAPSQAQFVTRCVGEGGAVTVPGDLVVPAGEACTLVGTTVEGNVRVRPGADLILSEATIGGNIVLRDDAFLDATDSSIAGNVTNRGGFGTFLEGTDLGAYTATAAAEETQSPFLYADDAAFGDRIDATGGSVLLESSTVAASLLGEGIEFTDLLDTVVEGDLEVVDNEFGALVCSSDIDGDARYADNQFGVQLGGTGQLDTCDGLANYWGGDVSIDDTTGGVEVNGNIVRGDLGGEGNDPAPVGADNRVRGTLTGQFADLQPASQMSMRQSRPVEATERHAELDTARESRLSEAVDQAEMSGQADL